MIHVFIKISCRTQTLSHWHSYRGSINIGDLAGIGAGMRERESGRVGEWESGRRERERECHCQWDSQSLVREGERRGVCERRMESER